MLDVMTDDPVWGYLSRVAVAFRRYGSKSLAIVFNIMVMSPVSSFSEDYIAITSLPHDYGCRVALVDIVQEIDKSLFSYPEGSLFELNAMLQKRLPMKCKRNVFIEVVMESKTFKRIEETKLVLIANFENGSGSSGLGFLLDDDLIELGWAHVVK